MPKAISVMPRPRGAHQRRPLRLSRAAAGLVNLAESGEVDMVAAIVLIRRALRRVRLLSSSLDAPRRQG